MDKKTLLIINDVTGYGRVSTFAMLPIFAKYGLHAYVLPTALVSNTMDYGSAEILDTTSFMQKTIEKWNEFGFKFKAINTGLINSAEQADIICCLIDAQDSPFVIVDPIMADDGLLYPDMYEGSIECNRKLASKADVIIPNITEATFLVDKYIGQSVLTDSQYLEILKDLAALGPKNIVITGCSHENGRHFNLVYDVKSDSVKQCYYENLPYKLIGTGDVFSAVLTAELLNGATLLSSVESAAQFVKNVVNNNKDNSDPNDILLENILL